MLPRPYNELILHALLLLSPSISCINFFPDSMMEGSVRGTKFASTPSGWVNSDAFIQWFLKHFRPQIAKRPLILLYDGHLQFISVRVLERAREDGVLLFPLPPHPAYNHCIENTCFHAFNVSHH